MRIIVILFFVLIGLGYCFPIGITPPSFPWIFVVVEHTNDFKITGLKTITNTPRHYTMVGGPDVYDWYVETPYSVLLFVNGKIRYLYSIVRVPRLNYRYDRLPVVPKIKGVY